MINILIDKYVNYNEVKKFASESFKLSTKFNFFLRKTYEHNTLTSSLNNNHN